MANLGSAAKVRVYERSLRYHISFASTISNQRRTRNAVGRVIRQHLRQQIQTRLIQPSDRCGEVRSGPLREGVFVVGQSGHTLPDFLVWCPEYTATSASARSQGYER